MVLANKTKLLAAVLWCGVVDWRLEVDSWVGKLKARSRRAGLFDPHHHIRKGTLGRTRVRRDDADAISWCAFASAAYSTAPAPPVCAAAISAPMHAPMDDTNAADRPAVRC